MQDESTAENGCAERRLSVLDMQDAMAFFPENSDIRIGNSINHSEKSHDLKSTD